MQIANEEWKRGWVREEKFYTSNASFKILIIGTY